MNGDIKLIRKMQKGDIEAFDLFVCKYYKDILKYCFYHSGNNEEDAKDLTQNTFLQVRTHGEGEKLSIHHCKKSMYRFQKERWKKEYRAF